MWRYHARVDRFRALLVDRLGGEPLPRGAIADFARETGVRDHVISRWLDKAQPRRPSPENLARIAPAMRVPYDELISMVYGGQTTSVALAAHDPDEAHVIALFRRVPADKRTAAADMLRGLAAAVPPIRPPRPNRRSQPDTNRQRRPAAEIERDHPHGGEIDANDGLPRVYAREIRHPGPARYLLAQPSAA